jgi:hypothetical protein
MFLENLHILRSPVYREDGSSGASVDYTRTNRRREQNHLLSWVDTRYIVKTVRERATRTPSFPILCSERATIVVCLEMGYRKFDDDGTPISDWSCSRLLKHRSWAARLVQRRVWSWLGSISDNPHPISESAYLSPAVEMNISLVVTFDGAVITILEQ